MLLEASTIETIASKSLYIFARIASLFLAAPFFNSQLLPLRVKLVLASLLTLLTLPLIKHLEAVSIFSFDGLIILLEQILIGISIGVIFLCLFQIIITTGQIIALQSGLGFATLVDPQNYETLPIISEFYLITTLLLFLSINGHTHLLAVIINSFQLLPIGGGFGDIANFQTIVAYVGNIFAGAVMLALPAIISLIMINLTFAFMSRTAYQLNIFTIGFPLILLSGLFVMYLNLPDMVNHIESIINSGFDIVQEYIRT